MLPVEQVPSASTYIPQQSMLSAQYNKA